MRPGAILILMTAPTLVAIYTGSFGLRLAKSGNTRGAIGVFILAAACVIAPLALLILRG
ncbi:MAG: hypothetical protein GX795_06155 [Firmicutes bacterium]|jgi:hypothetical protein|nr:hypothetical protein [Bacillota bacterium]